jgi:hypothetical protein
MIQFGEWLPDQADLLNPGVITALSDRNNSNTILYR